MGFVIFICIAAVIGLAVIFLGAPLRGASDETTSGEALAEGSTAAADANLEVAREAKYREIRDAELDFRTGKLSQQDYSRIDAELRAEALAILNALERSNARRAQSAPGSVQDPAEPA